MTKMKPPTAADSACIAELEAKLAAAETSNEHLIATAAKLMNENQTLKETGAETESDKIEVEEQYATLLEQTVDLMGDKIKTLTSLPQQGGPKKLKPVVVCIFCYMRDLPCDRGTPCRECLKAKRTCKRAKCQDYEAGTCRRKTCQRAHKGDREYYDNIVYVGHVPKAKKSVARSRKRGNKVREKMLAN